MKDKTFTKADLAQFTGTENWYRHMIVRAVLYTDGIKYLAERAGAYWLIDEIAFYQLSKPVAVEEFQLWKLTVDPDEKGILQCEDGNGRILLTKKIPYTDFPFDDIKIFFTNNVMMLPSEY
ncbi:MAG: hypothetical protein PSV16_00605 [Flavobacterium sp.]|nr:hypothetical protein [Flavobacterium sp.]